MQRIGIFSGTFDPVHAGHLAFAREARRQAGLTRVVFVPEAQPRHKQHVSALAQRLTGLQAAVGDDADLTVLQLRSERFDIAHTLPELAAALPDAEVELLMGSDVAGGLAGWPDVAKLLETIPLIVGLRGDAGQAQLERTLTGLYDRNGLRPTFRIIRADHSHVSSSQLRKAS